MLKYDNYEIMKMYICSFERNNGILSFDISKYPERLCVCDKNNKVVIDVETLHQYPYINALNRQTFYDIGDVKTIGSSNRVGCIEYATIPYELETESLEMCINIIEQLKNDVEFQDGNEVYDNKAYLEYLKEEALKETQKSKNKIKIFTKRKK